MPGVRRFLIVVLTVLMLSGGAAAGTARITNGSMIFGGSAFGTPDYQTFVSFDLDASFRSPWRIFRMNALQPFSVFLNFPAQPNGPFSYKVVMPYGPQRLTIDGTPIYPVWYEDCRWEIESDITTPLNTPESPQFIDVSAPMAIKGITSMFGGRSDGFRISGHGTLRVRFEKIGREYYMREAVVYFGSTPPPAGLTD